MRIPILLAIFTLSGLSAWSQTPPRNDECATATVLTNVTNWCSGPGAFTTAGSTPSSLARPSCFPDNPNTRDVWFSFVARATDVNISITGNTALNPGGTLETPQLALYSGTCGSLVQTECISDGFNANFVQTFAGKLRIGAVYFIRVSARDGKTGTFQLCINNFNQSPDASSDCATANILCSKAPFTVEAVTGEGKDPNEVTGVCGRLNCQPEEEQSTWFKWTCLQAGTLTFKITPLNPVDDIDFVVFELPGGVNSCNNKRAVRCMSAGENVGQPFSTWRSCTGATGLRDGETDNIEYCGCDPGANNFISPLDMVAGRSYALVINNFSRSGSGFTIEFGGTGTFVGPAAKFTADQTSTCVGKTVNLTDASSFAGTISKYEWFLDQTASSASFTGKGPHAVRYDLPGTKTIVLNITTSDGCVVSYVDTLVITCCSDQFQLGSALRPPSCPGANSGSIDLSVRNNYAPYQFRWQSGQQSEDLSSLTAGSYQVTITDRATCDTVVRFTLTEPPPILLTPQVKPATCNGGRDGGITIQASGATPPYQYRFPGGTFGAGNRADNLPVGDYLITVRDSNNCTFDTLVLVRELELILDPNVAAIQPPTCTGFANGAIQVRITNGLPPYRYNWNDGQGFRDVSSLQSVRSGTYQVLVQDVNLCKGTFTFNVQDPPPVGLRLNLRDVNCFGGADGRVEVSGSGGSGSYRYLWSNGFTGSVRDSLAAGNYPIRLEDSKGCLLDTTVTIIQPPQLTIQDIQAANLRCFEDNSGRITLLGAGGTPPFTYNLGNQPFQASNTFDKLPAGLYIVAVSDARGCTAAAEIRIDQPPKLTVDAGLDLTIDLGQQAILQAIPSEIPVTFQWAPADLVNCTTCASPVAVPLRNTTFTVRVTNADSCTAVDEVAVIVVKNRPLFIPNAFSPNSDGVNDFFTIYGGPSARSIHVLRIFDRWGELVFEGTDLPLGSEPLGWDGTFRGQPLSSGVFVYYAEIEFIDGEVLSVSGDVSLVR